MNKIVSLSKQELEAIIAFLPETDSDLKRKLLEASTNQASVINLDMAEVHTGMSSNVELSLEFDGGNTIWWGIAEKDIPEGSGRKGVFGSFEVANGYPIVRAGGCIHEHALQIAGTAESDTSSLSVVSQSQGQSGSFEGSGATVFLVGGR